jgi:RNA polymerase sigma factor (sigma-70 family)
LVRTADAASRAAQQVDRNVELEQFYRAELPKLLRFLAFVGAQPADAADASHQAMVEVCVRWAQVREMERPTAYLRRVAENEWKRLGRRLRQDVRHAVAGRWIDLAVVEDLYGRDDVKVVLKSLAVLPDRQRQVMAWLYDGYTVEEIAEQLGMKASTVRSTVRHAREKLRSLGIGEEG